MSDLVELTQFLDRSLADVAKSKLESEGVFSMIQADDLAGLRPHMSFGHAVKLYVHKADFEKAFDILLLGEDSLGDPS